VTAAAIGLGGALTAVSGPTAAAEWKYSSWTALTAPNNRLGTIPLIEDVKKETNGGFNIQNFMGGQLFDARSTLKGISEGIVDAGVIVPAFTAAELKHNAIVTDAPPLFTDGWASTGAANEILFHGNPEQMQDFLKLNTITLGVYSPGQSYLQCLDDIQSVDDLKGKKVAGVGSSTARWAAALGQARQQIGPGDLLPAMQRRQVDCTMSPLEFLFALSLKDVVRTVVEHPSGAFPAVHLMVVNKNSWNKLSGAEKQTLIKAMAPAVARVVNGYNNDEERARKEAAAEGAKFVELPALDPMWDKFVQSEKETIIGLAKDRGIAADVAERIIDEHLRLLEKWTAIMDRVGRTREGMEKALWEEVYSKIDLEKFGK
jgi:TRAP-type C4-dicarboxylate transport system substrate-binding protein